MLKNFGGSQKPNVELFVRAVDEFLSKTEIKEAFFKDIVTAIVQGDTKQAEELVAEIQNSALKRKLKANIEDSDKDTYKYLLALREFESKSYANAIYTSMLILKSQHIPRNDVLKIITNSVEALLDTDFSMLSLDDKESIKDGISILLKLTNEDYNSVKLKAEYALKNKQYAVSLQYLLKAYELMDKENLDYEIIIKIAENAEKLDAQRTIYQIVENALTQINTKRKTISTPEDLGKFTQQYSQLSYLLAKIYLAIGESAKATSIFTELHAIMPKNDEISAALTEAQNETSVEIEDILSSLKFIETQFETEEEKAEFIKQELKQVEILCDMKNRPDLAREILLKLPEEYLHPQSDELTEIQAYIQIRLGFCNLLLGIGDVEENYRKCKQVYEQYSDNSTIFSIYLFVLASAGKDEEIAGMLLDEDWQNSMVESNAMPQQLLDFTKNFEHLIEEGDFEAAGEELKALKQFIDPRMRFMHAPLMLHSTFLYGPLPPKITKAELIESFENLEETWNRIPKLYRAMNGLEFYMFLWQASQKPFSIEDPINLSDTPPLGKLFNEIIIKSWFGEAFFKMREGLSDENFMPTMENWLSIAKQRQSLNDQQGTKIAMTFSAISKFNGQNIFNDNDFEKFCADFIKFGLSEMETVSLIVNDIDPEKKKADSGLPFDNSEMMRIQIQLVFTIFPIIRLLCEIKRNKPTMFENLQTEIVPRFSFGFEVFNYVEKTF